MIANYVVLNDEYFALNPEQQTEEKLTFEIPHNAVVDDAVLMFKVVATDAKNLKFHVLINDHEEQWAMYSDVTTGTLHEVIDGLRPGSNVATFKLISGTGTLRIGDAFIMYHQIPGLAP